MNLKNILYSWIALFILTLIAIPLLALHLLNKLFSKNHKTTNTTPMRLVVIGTFHNPGWFVSHVTPLAKCHEIDEVLVICDDPVSLNMKNVFFYCPSQKLTDHFGRNIARLFMLVKVGFTIHPHLYMGYHIMPNALFALLGARLFGGHAIYQMTGGPIQIKDGGYNSENPLLRSIGTPSKYAEKLLYSLVRCFDAVVVRGSKAKAFLKQNNLAKDIFTITGAIDTKIFRPAQIEKKYDLVYVSRLVPVKGLEFFLTCVSALSISKPNVSAAIVGDGPLKEMLIKKAIQFGINRNICFLGKLEDVTPILQQSKIFVLLSENEGMSIAMLEAMACGLPVVVRDVGDLKDMVHIQGGGILLDNISKENIVNILNDLLDNYNFYNKFSRAARDTAKLNCSIDAISNRWNKYIIELNGNK